MKKVILALCCIVLLCGCSESEDSPSVPLGPLPTDMFTLKINGTEIPFLSSSHEGDPGPYYNNYISNVRLYGHDFGVTGSFQGKMIFITFNDKEKFVSMRIQSGGSFSANEPHGGMFDNYPNYRSYYVHSEIHHDVANQKVSAIFSGKLYSIGDDLNSEAITVECEIKNQTYEIVSTPPYGEELSAKFNGVTWDGTWKDDATNSFISDDPYKLKLFIPTATVGVYNFSATSTSNRMILYRFNTETATFDTYNCSGTINLEQINLWSTSYMYIGTFSLTAVNPNNASDVIQVTDGKFQWKL